MTDKFTNKLNYEIKGKLKNIAKKLAQNYEIKIGLLAEHSGSESIGENMDLAGLGAVLEYGADIKITQKMAAYLHFKAKELGLPEKKEKGDGYIHIPARSWLYEPIVKGDLIKYLKENFLPDSEFFEEFAEDKDYEKLAKKIAEICLLQIFKAFENGGIHGEWAKNSEFTIAGKNSNKPLIDTGYLEQHITYEINKK